MEPVEDQIVPGRSKPVQSDGRADKPAGGGKPSYADSENCNYHDPADTPDEIAEAEDGKRVQRAAEILSHRRADGRLRDALAAEDFAGPAYHRFAEELAAYGVAVCTAWMQTGEMFRQCALRGYPIGFRPDWSPEHDITSIAGETVVRALADFRAKGLVGGGWREDGGASLKTYFMTRCVYAFLNVYRSWRHSQRHLEMETTIDPADIALLDKPGSRDPSELAVAQVQVDELFADMTEAQQQILVLRGLDYSHAEIAELVGRSTTGIERAFGRIRHSHGGRGPIGGTSRDREA